MPDKCRKAAGAKLERCDAMQGALDNDFVVLHTLRDLQTGKRRQQLVLTKGRKQFALNFCPWCRAVVDTRPFERDADPIPGQGGS